MAEELKGHETIQGSEAMMECAVCLGFISDGCLTTPCQHKFCRQCILKVLEMKPPEWSGACPICRANISIYNLRDETGLCLAQPDTTNLYGCVFVQGGGLGVASYHFDAPDNCYISYASAPASWKLDDGSRPAEKKHWVDHSYDEATRTFRGIIEWSPAFSGMDRWEYEIVFAEDFAGVVGGQVEMRYSSGNVQRTSFQAPWEASFNRALAYLRWTPPPSSIFGCVYVQGAFYAPMLEGIASYHFDAEDDCYISYANAPPDWLLDDGSMPPVKKAFASPAFDVGTRTFRGQILWDPLFGGAARWDYEMVFAEDFTSIVGGQLHAYGSDGRQSETVPFLNANNRRSFHRDGMIYVQKPQVMTAGARARQVAATAVRDP